MDDIREKLDAEIDARLERLKTIKDEGIRAEEVRQLTELYKLRLDDKKLDDEKDIQAKNRRLETVGLIIPNTIDTVVSIIGLPVSFIVSLISSVYGRSSIVRRLRIYLIIKWIASSTPQPIAIDEKLTVTISNGIPDRNMKI